jgi:hypothetical protein
VLCALILEHFSRLPATNRVVMLAVSAMLEARSHDSVLDYLAFLEAHPYPPYTDGAITMVTARVHAAMGHEALARAALEEAHRQLARGFAQPLSVAAAASAAAVATTSTTATTGPHAAAARAAAAAAAVAVPATSSESAALADLAAAATSLGGGGAAATAAAAAPPPPPPPHVSPARARRAALFSLDALRAPSPNAEEAATMLDALLLSGPRGRDTGPPLDIDRSWGAVGTCALRCLQASARAARSPRAWGALGRPWELLGWVHAAAEQWAQARGCFEHAQGLARGDGGSAATRAASARRLAEGVAMALWRSNHPHDAVADLEAIVRGSPSDARLASLLLSHWAPSRHGPPRPLHIAGLEASASDDATTEGAATALQALARGRAVRRAAAAARSAAAASVIQRAAVRHRRRRADAAAVTIQAAARGRAVRAAAAQRAGAAVELQRVWRGRLGRRAAAAIPRPGDVAATAIQRIVRGRAARALAAGRRDAKCVLAEWASEAAAAGRDSYDDGRGWDAAVEAGFYRRAAAATTADATARRDAAAAVRRLAARRRRAAPRGNTQPAGGQRPRAALARGAGPVTLELGPAAAAAAAARGMPGPVTAAAAVAATASVGGAASATPHTRRPPALLKQLHRCVCMLIDNLVETMLLTNTKHTHVYMVHNPTSTLPRPGGRIS